MTVFQKIIEGKIPCSKVFENERILAFEDIAPAAPVHILIIPKKPIPSLQEADKEDLPLLAEIMGVARDLAEKYNIANGYRLLTNVGPDSGQAVPHLHFHLLGGKKLGPIG